MYRKYHLMGSEDFEDFEKSEDKDGCHHLLLHTGIPPFIVLHFIALYRYLHFYKLKVCGNPVWSKSFSAIFPTSVAPFVSLSRFCNSCNISNFHYYICYGDL